MWMMLESSSLSCSIAERSDDIVGQGNTSTLCKHVELQLRYEVRCVTVLANAARISVTEAVRCAMVILRTARGHSEPGLLETVPSLDYCYQ
ncbi:hypothetical protein TNCV_4269871 [Trichonephila clavipes]|nr:hypothetical protein TNCV_4269871 [Trichonephila clavipes]